MKNIGKKLRQARKNMGWTQKELSNESTVVQSSIAQFETNIRIPPDTTLELLCRALNVSMEWVKEEDGDISTFPGAANDKLISTGQRLKSRLDAIKMTPNKLAFMSEIDEKLITEYIDDGRHMTVNHCRQIAFVIGVKAAWLAFGE